MGRVTGADVPPGGAQTHPDRLLLVVGDDDLKRPNCVSGLSCGPWEGQARQVAESDMPPRVGVACSQAASTR